MCRLQSHLTLSRTYIDWIVAFVNFFFGQTEGTLLDLFMRQDLTCKRSAQQRPAFHVTLDTTNKKKVANRLLCCSLPQLRNHNHILCELWRPMSTLLCCLGPRSGLRLEMHHGFCIERHRHSVFQSANRQRTVLSCIVDIATATVPAFLLWNVRMRRRTKIVLNIIFTLGVVTAGLSIGRAVTSPETIFETDLTCKLGLAHAEHKRSLLGQR